MSMPLREFLRARRQELAEEMRRIRGEMRDIAAAEQALDQVSAAASTARPLPSADQPAATGRGMTLKERALEVLADRSEGATTAELVDLIEARFKERPLRESLSPQLSRLGAVGLVRLHGSKWYRPPSTPLVGEAAAEVTPQGDSNGQA